MADARLIDAHVHIRSLDGLAMLAAAGIAAARDAGVSERAEGKGPDFRNAKPRIVSAQWALYKKGGYGGRFGVAVEDRKEIKAEISRLKRAGADIIKVMASGMVSLKEPNTITPGGFSEGELAEIVDEAGRLGLPVMAHANGEAAVRSAVRAGVRSIEHGFFMTMQAIEEMAARRTFWVPTVGALARAAQAKGTAAEMQEYIYGMIQAHLGMIGQAHAQGVPLAVGTDWTLPAPGYGESYQAELAYFERAGLSRDAVLTIAREGGAELLEV